MSRKGRLTTKGKHALILALTIAACVTAMLFSLLLSVLCDGKYVSSAAHAGDISHPASVSWIHLFMSSFLQRTLTLRSLLRLRINQ